MNEEIKKTIAHELKILRINNNMTQSDVARKVGINEGTIVRYEKNNVTMQIDTIAKIISAYGIDIFSFFEIIIAKTHEKEVS